LLKLRTERFEQRMQKRSFRSHLDRAGYKGSPRCLTMQGAFGLWAEYVQQADENLRGPSNAVHTLKYEDMLAEPTKHLPILANFCGLRSDPAKIETAIKQIDASRATAFKTDPASAAFYETVKQNPWMTKFG